jgi:hypothetical protein
MSVLSLSGSGHARAEDVRFVRIKAAEIRNVFSGR